MSKKTISIRLLISLFILLISVFFIPLIFPKFFIDPLGKRPAIEDIVLTKLDLLNPTFSVIIKNGKEGYLVSVEEFTRENLIFWKSKKNIFAEGSDYRNISAKIENKNIEEVKQITSQYDLRVKNPDINNITSTGEPINSNENNPKLLEKEASKAENRGFDLVKLATFDGKRSILDFISLKIGDKINKITQLSNPEEKPNSGGVSFYSPVSFNYDKANNELVSETQSLVNVETKVSAIAFKIKCAEGSRCDGSPEDSLLAINIILKDRTVIPVPTKPDGTFDFEAVKGSWE